MTVRVTTRNQLFQFLDKKKKKKKKKRISLNFFWLPKRAHTWKRNLHTKTNKTKMQRKKSDDVRFKNFNVTTTKSDWLKKFKSKGRGS